MEHIGDDKRKLAHVTSMFGVNMFKKERNLQVSRWNWIVRRNEPVRNMDFMYVAHCLALDNPCVKCCYHKG